MLTGHILSVTSTPDTDFSAVEIKCPFCGRIEKILFDIKGIDLYFNEDVCIKTAFPNDAVSKRERLLSGICPDCWDNMMRSEEEPIDFDSEND